MLGGCWQCDPCGWRCAVATPFACVAGPEPSHHHKRPLCSCMCIPFLASLASCKYDLARRITRRWSLVQFKSHAQSLAVAGLLLFLNRWHSSIFKDNMPCTSHETVRRQQRNSLTPSHVKRHCCSSGFHSCRVMWSTKCSLHELAHGLKWNVPVTRPVPGSASHEAESVGSRKPGAVQPWKLSGQPVEANLHRKSSTRSKYHEAAGVCKT